MLGLRDTRQLHAAVVSKVDTEMPHRAHRGCQGKPRMRGVDPRCQDASDCAAWHQLLILRAEICCCAARLCVEGVGTACA